MTALFGALGGGGDTVEIVVALRNLTGAGFAKLDSELKGLNTSANNVNLSRTSKGVKTLEKDAEAAAGSSGGGGIAGLAAAASGLVGPLMLVGGALAAGAVVGDQIVQTYEKVEAQEKQLAIAAKDHGIAQKALNAAVEEAIPVGENYGYSADQTRQAILQLTEAGLTLAQQQEALPHVFDLARAKQIDLDAATQAYTSSVFGNARALKQYGIILPQVSTSAADVGKAQAAVQKAEEAQQKATEDLGLTEEQLAAKQKMSGSEALRLQIAHDAVTAAIKKHGANSAQAKLAEEKYAVAEQALSAKLHLSAADHLKLERAQQKVTDASDKLKKAQQALTLAQQGGIDKGDRLKMVNAGLEKAIGGQAGGVTSLQKMQAKLNDSWERFATTVGPALETAFGGLLNILSSFVDVLNNIAGAIATVVGAIMTAKAKTGMSTGNAHIGNVPIMGGHAEGGWVGLHGPEVAVLGERGPEYVIPNDQLGSMGGSSTHVIQVQLDGYTVAEVIERHLARRVALQSTSALMGLGGV